MTKTNYETLSRHSHVRVVDVAGNQLPDVKVGSAQLSWGQAWDVARWLCCDTGPYINMSGLGQLNTAKMVPYERWQLAGRILAAANSRISREVVDETPVSDTRANIMAAILRDVGWVCTPPTGDNQ